MKEILKKLPTFVTLWMTILLLGCVHPKVTYLMAPLPNAMKENPTIQQDDEGKIKFRLTATRAVLGEKKTDPQDTKKVYTDINTNNCITTDTVSALVVPREDQSAIFAVIPQSQWLWMVETKLSVSYFDNTRLIQKIGMQVEDNRIKAIEAIGTVASLVAKAALRGSAKCDADSIRVPVAIDIDIEKVNGNWEVLPSNEGVWFYRVTSTAEEPDAVPRMKYFKDYYDRFFSIFQSTRSFPISSCRQAYLRIGKTKDDGAALITLPIQVADYMNVRTYEMPDKGSISSHTLCGADITTEKSDVASSFEVLSALVKQAMTIKEAQDAKK